MYFTINLIKISILSIKVVKIDVNFQSSFNPPTMLTGIPGLARYTWWKMGCNQTWKSWIFDILGPGRPSAGGPRMDRQAVTSPGVVKVSRLTSRQRRSARRGSDQTAVLIKLFKKKYKSFSYLCYWQLAKRVPAKTVTDSLPRECDPKL